MRLEDHDYDPRHDIPIRVTILDTVTGERKQDAWSFGTYWWTEGNGGCDCNRRVVFEGMDGDHPCENKRYLIVAVEPLLPGYSVADFNGGYPIDVCDAALGPAAPGGRQAGGG